MDAPANSIFYNISLTHVLCYEYQLPQKKYFNHRSGLDTNNCHNKNTTIYTHYMYNHTCDIVYTTV